MRRPCADANRIERKDPRESCMPVAGVFLLRTGAGGADCRPPFTVRALARYSDGSQLGLVDSSDGGALGGSPP
jgi:hypothetical protein